MFNLSADDAFDRRAFINALVRGRIQELDNLGIILLSRDIDIAYQRYSQMIGHSDLTDRERQQALIDWILSGRPH